MRRSGFLRTILNSGCTFLLFGTVASANLITNGDFSSGLSGFSTNYGYVAPASQGSCYPETTFSLVTSPNVCHNLWANFGDHTTGTGSMMVVNGATSSGFNVWAAGSATGSGGMAGLQQNTDYYFSGWVASAYPTSPARLRFAVDGSQAGGHVVLGEMTASPTTGLWQQFFFTWNSGSNTGAGLSILDLNTDAYGNDFALDDLKFDTLASLSSVPEPSSLIALVCAGLLLLIAGRRWSTRG